MAAALPDKIWIAARRGDVARLEAWLRAGGCPNGRDRHGRTLLSHAATTGQCGAIEALLAGGADADAADAGGKVPLHFAANFAQSGALALLLARGGARVDARRTFYGTSPLMFAAQKGAVAALRLLVRRGADCRARDRWGRDAAAHARRWGRRDAAAFLAACKAAGGTWDRYVRAPRVALLVLRAQCERGRATPPPGVLDGLFGPTRARRRAPHRRPAPPALPREVFWLVLSYWRSDRDP